MSAKKIADGVATIENEAEKILEKARKRASEIMLKAQEESGKILSTGLSLDEAEKERQQIISSAEEKAKKKISQAKKRAGEIGQSAAKKSGKVVERIVAMVIGAEVR